MKADIGKESEMPKRITDRFQPCISDTVTAIISNQNMYLFRYILNEVKADIGKGNDMPKRVTERYQACIGDILTK